MKLTNEPADTILTTNRVHGLCDHQIKTLNPTPPPITNRGQQRRRTPTVPGSFVLIVVVSHYFINLVRRCKQLPR